MISNPLSVLDFLVSEGCHCEAFFGVATGFFVGATAAFCADRNPLFFVGVGLVPTHPSLHGGAAILYFVGARQNSPRHDPKGSASPLPHGTRRGALPQRADRNPPAGGSLEQSRQQEQTHQRKNHPPQHPGVIPGCNLPLPVHFSNQRE